MTFHLYAHDLAPCFMVCFFFGGVSAEACMYMYICMHICDFVRCCVACMCDIVHEIQNEAENFRLVCVSVVCVCTYVCVECMYGYIIYT